jgi:hypothetical protein
MERVRERAGHRRSYLHRRARRPSQHLASCLQRIQDAEDRRRRRHERIVAKARRHLLVVERKRTRVQHVRRMQGWWRTIAVVDSDVDRLFDGRVIQLYAKVIMAAQRRTTSDSDPAAAFERLAKHLSSPQVNDSAAELLSLLRVFKSKSSKAKVPSSGRRSKASVASLRQFLSSVMLLSHPEVVLGLDSGSTEEDRHVAELLLTSARSMLASLQKVVDAIEEQDAKRTSLRLYTFAIARTLYDREFASWKARDAAKLAREMRQTLVTIRVNLATLNAHAENAHNMAHVDPGAEHIRGGWVRQDASIVRRVKQLLKPVAMEAWMRDVDQQVAQEMVTVSHEIQQQQEQLDQQNEGALAQQDGDEIAKVDEPSISTSPVLPSNSDMVHELILNPQFRLARIRNDTSGAALKQLSDELRQKELGMLTRVLQDIATRLCALTPNRPDLQTKIKETLDVAYLAQQMRHGAFTAESFVRVLDFVGERVTGLQAPARTAATTEWLNQSRQDILRLAASCTGVEWTEAVAPVLERVLGDLADIEMDVANVHLGMLSSSLPRAGAVSYLRSKWDELSAAAQGGSINWPAITREWIREAREQVDQPAQLQQQTRQMLSTYVAHGVVSILTSETPTTGLPEIIELHDRSRVERLGNELTRLARLGTLELGLRHALGVRCGLRLPGLGSTADRQLLGITRDELNDAVVLASSSSSSSSSQSQYADALAEVTSALCAAADHACRVANSPLRDDLSAELGALASQALKGGPLFGVVHRRLLAGLRSAASSGQDQVSKETLRGSGVQVWVDAVNAMTTELTSLVRLYCDVYGQGVLSACLE